MESPTLRLTPARHHETISPLFHPRTGCSGGLCSAYPPGQRLSAAGALQTGPLPFARPAKRDELLCRGIIREQRKPCVVLETHPSHLLPKLLCPGISVTPAPTWGMLAMCCRSVRSVAGTAPSPGSICSFTRWLVTKAQMALVLPGIQEVTGRSHRASPSPPPSSLSSPSQSASSTLFPPPTLFPSPSACSLWGEALQDTHRMMMEVMERQTRRQRRRQARERRWARRRPPHRRRLRQ